MNTKTLDELADQFDSDKSTKSSHKESVHITKDEQKYLEDNIADIKIYDDIQNAYSVAIFTKK